MKTSHYFIVAGLIFVFLGLFDRSLDLIDPCYQSHTDYCVWQPDYQAH